MSRLHVVLVLTVRATSFAAPQRVHSRLREAVIARRGDNNERCRGERAKSRIAPESADVKR